jgi:hypothetical protein
MSRSHEPTRFAVGQGRSDHWLLGPTHETFATVSVANSSLQVGGWTGGCIMKQLPMMV